MGRNCGGHVGADDMFGGHAGRGLEIWGGWCLKFVMGAN